MASSLLTVGEIVTIAISLAGIGYYLTALWAAADYRRKAPPKEGTPFSPPVSILKPLKGDDPEMHESFRSHCLQNYPEYELIFGVRDPADPAVRAVEELRREFPQHSIRLVVCSESLGTNAKVSNLVQMARAACYDHFIVSDSDIRVSPDYLQRVMAPFSANSKVGVVTCLYRGVAGPTLGSKLEALGISTDFLAGVLVARVVEGVRFALGSTMGFRRDDLQAIGGFESILDYLADDHELGKRIVALGREVVISEEIVDTFLPAYTFGQFVDHQLRWARGVRAARPGGYLGLLFTFGWQWAGLAVWISKGAFWSWGVLALAASLRALVAWSVGWRVLKDRQVLRLSPILPLRDLIAPLIWVASFASKRITWRGDRFTVDGGKLTRTTSQ